MKWFGDVNIFTWLREPQPPYINSCNITGRKVAEALEATDKPKSQQKPLFNRHFDCSFFFFSLGINFDL
jgi:hypothetical protein